MSIVLNEVVGLSFCIELKRFSVYNYKVRSKKNLFEIRRKLRRGNYRSNVPFGLISIDENNFSILLNEKDNPPNTIFVGDILLSLDSKISVIGDINKKSPDQFIQATMDYLLCDIGRILIDLGFTRPQDVRTFMNRFLKGIYSKRDTPIDEVWLDGASDIEGKLKRRFTLNEAVSLGIWRLNQSNEILVSLFPRHEIMELGLSFPIRYELKEKLQEHWENKIKWNGNKIKLVTKDIINKIGDYLVKKDYCKKYLPFPSDEIIQEKLDEPCYKVEYEKDLYQRKHEIAETYLRKIFLDVKTKLPRISTSVLIDKNISKSLIDPFLSAFCDYVPVTIEEIKEIENIDDFEFSTDSVILMLNNKIEGYQGYYKWLKSKLVHIPNKVVLLETVEKCQTDSYEIFIHIYLALLHRKTGSLFWQLNREKFDLVVGIKKTSRLKGNIQAAVLTLNNSDKLRTISKLLYRYQDFDVVDVLIKIVKEEIISNNLDKEIKILILFNNENTEMILKFSEEMEKISRASIWLANIDDRENLRILRIVENEKDDMNPYRGSYIYLGYSKPFHNFALITTGYPDIAQNSERFGFTRPVITQVFDPKNDYSMKSLDFILENIYFHSQIHPASLVQTSLPIELHNCNKAADLVVNSILLRKELPKGVL